LTIAERKGSFANMPTVRRFSIVLAGKGKAAGMKTEKIDKEVSYNGKKVVVKL
jgi:hypothetical protein